MPAKQKCLYDLLGWQGGTIHQVADALGFSNPSDLIYGEPLSPFGSDSDYIKGQYAYTTCSQSWVKDRLIPKYQGNLDFWLGYMRAFELDQL